MRIRCAGAIVFDPDGRLLVIRRLREPGAGLWSVPGGKCEPGESAEQACAREVREETGLTVSVGRLAGRVERPGARPGDVFVIDDFVCELVDGTLAAGDDAADACWVDAGRLRELPLVEGLLDALAGWDCLPRR